jgi:nitrogen regulatory protein PII
MIFLFASGFFLKKVRESYAVKMVTCVIRPEQFIPLTTALDKQNLMLGMTVMDVRGFGRQRGDREHPLPGGDHEIRFLPKLKLEILVPFRQAERLIEAIAQTLRTGEIGDGKIVVYEAAHLMRVRTGEKGLSAIH